MTVSSNEYQNHPVFGDIDFFIEFYRFMSDQTSFFFKSGVRSALSMDSLVFSSIQATLESIRALLRAGALNDAYALIRKYYDSAIIHAYTSHYLEAHVSLDNFIVECIEDWCSGKAKLPSFKLMVEYLRRAESVRAISAMLDADNRYERIRRRCNDHAHYNYFAHLLANVTDFSFEGRTGVLAQIQRDVRDILVLHFTYIFVIHFIYLGSSDYLDALECGLEPEPHSQYWVAGLIQEMFDTFITPWRPDATEIVRTLTPMELR